MNTWIIIANSGWMATAIISRAYSNVITIDAISLVTSRTRTTLTRSLKTTPVRGVKRNTKQALFNIYENQYDQWSFTRVLVHCTRGVILHPPLLIWHSSISTQKWPFPLKPNKRAIEWTVRIYSTYFSSNKIEYIVNIRFWAEVIKFPSKRSIKKYSTLTLYDIVLVIKEKWKYFVFLFFSYFRRHHHVFWMSFSKRATFSCHLSKKQFSGPMIISIFKSLDRLMRLKYLDIRFTLASFQNTRFAF